VDAARIGLWGTGTGGANVIYAAAVDTRVRAVVCSNGQGDVGRWLRSGRSPEEWAEVVRLFDEDRVQRALTGRSRLVETSAIFSRDPGVWERLRRVQATTPGLASRKRELTVESGEALAEFRPEEVAHRIAPRAAAWICSADEPRDVLEAQSSFDRAGEPKSLVTIPGYFHHELYMGEGFQKLLAHSRQWFDAHL